MLFSPRMGASPAQPCSARPAAAPAAAASSQGDEFIPIRSWCTVVESTLGSLGMKSSVKTGVVYDDDS